MSRYTDERVATITAAEPAAPTLPWPIGTRLALEGEEGPWRLIEVSGMFDNGPDAGGYEPVVRPVEIVAGFDCAPRKVSPEAIVSLGYVVEDEGPDAEAWETPTAEVATPFEGSAS